MWQRGSVSVNIIRLHIVKCASLLTLNRRRKICVLNVPLFTLDCQRRELNISNMRVKQYTLMMYCQKSIKDIFLVSLIFNSLVCIKKKEENSMKVSELTGTALEWAVAKCEGLADHPIKVTKWGNGLYLDPDVPYRPAINWAQGGPIIEREGISTRKEPPSFPYIGGWYAVKTNSGLPFKSCDGFDGGGDTLLIAAMRCYVASKLGAEVDIPEELQGENHVCT
jgi:hypothetical protein